MLIKFTAQQSVRYLQIQSAQSTFDSKLTGRGSEMSRGRQFWESSKRKAFRLSGVWISEVLLYIQFALLAISHHSLTLTLAYYNYKHTCVDGNTQGDLKVHISY